MTAHGGDFDTQVKGQDVMIDEEKNPYQLGPRRSSLVGSVKEVSDQTHRKLKSRHIQLIGIGNFIIWKPSCPRTHSHMQVEPLERLCTFKLAAVFSMADQDPCFWPSVCGMYRNLLSTIQLASSVTILILRRVLIC